jgi:3D (Asp-Asp-Asp) domain-containing protein
MNTPDGPVQYWRVLKMRSASYKPSSAGRDPGDPLYGITATGQRLRKGMVAVDPKIIPLGTSLYVPGYGLAVAADTGGAVQGLVIDLGYGDDDYQAWSGPVDVYLLPPVPPADQIPILEETAQP